MSSKSDSTGQDEYNDGTNWSHPNSNPVCAANVRDRKKRKLILTTETQVQE